jgi:hypothetical protein
MTKFEGIWQKVEGRQFFTFHYNRMAYQIGLLTCSGTFTFTDTEITFIPDLIDTWTGWTQSYSLSEDELILHPDGSHIDGVFKKA